jgi:hypothetical protein
MKMNQIAAGGQVENAKCTRHTTAINMTADIEKEARSKHKQC